MTQTSFYLAQPIKTQMETSFDKQILLTMTKDIPSNYHYLTAMEILLEKRLHTIFTTITK